MNKVAVLCSGGVDSSVALALLKELKYDITVFYLKIWLEDELSYLGNCPWEDDVNYVRQTCEFLGVNFEQVSLQRDYWNKVVYQSIELIKNGYTPNPDVFCNQAIKFGVFNDNYGKNFDQIATGHYAARENVNGWSYLKMVLDEIKDQTYFLAYTSHSQLEKVIFPLEIFRNKQEVREYAMKLHLPSAHRKDSQGICFLGKIPFFDFIKYHCGEKEGLLINYENGKIEGKHRGFWFYTIGQRQGIGLSGGPWYVIAKNHHENIIYISTKNPKIFYSQKQITIKINAINYLVPSKEYLRVGFVYSVKLRHGKDFNKVEVVKVSDNYVEVLLKNNDQGLADGQFMVFYDQFYRCIGSGIMQIIL
jgi:tRNA-specific 2-thiouridylase